MTTDKFGRREGHDATVGAGSGAGSAGTGPVLGGDEGGGTSAPGDGWNAVEPPLDGIDQRPERHPEPEPEPEHGRIGYGRYARYTPAALAALLVMGLGLVGLVRNGAEDGPSVRPPAIEERMAPAATVRLLDGSRLPLADLRGSVVVLNFWASFCAPCKEEAPLLQALHEEAGRSREAVAVVGVGIRQEQDANARAFVRELGLTYPIGRDNDTEAPGNGPIEQAFGVTLLPTTVFIRPDGVVDRFHIGQLNQEQLRFAVEEAQTSDVASLPSTRDEAMAP